MTLLILTPTRLEHRALEPALSETVRRADGRIEICGFGPVAAAARSMQLISLHRPKRVILVGIAGSLRAELEVGAARSFQQVRCVGIGVGMGAAHKSAGEIGWQHWDAADAVGDESPVGIGDVLPLAPSPLDAGELGGELLTVCAGSASESEVETRSDEYPDAAAEEMEGFGVAVACSLAGVSLEIIRGISNLAGDRDPKHWKINAAIHSAGQLTLKALSG